MTETVLSPHDENDVVVLTRSEYAALYTDAAAWRELWASEHVRDLLAEWSEWRDRKLMSESTAAMAGAVNWRAVAAAPTYAEIEKRRSTYTTPALTPAEIRMKAAESWTRVSGSVPTNGRAA